MTMLHAIRTWLTKPFRWRKPGPTARLLLQFSFAERSSFLDMMAAAQSSPSAERRAQYLAHAVDEKRHGTMFALRAIELDPQVAAAASQPADFEHLFERLGEAAFVAFVFVGERRAAQQLRTFRAELAALDGTARADVKTRALLDAVLLDEARHEAYTERLAQELGGSLTRARLWELGRSWRRAGAQISGALFTCFTTVLYLSLAPLAWLERRRTP